jgi:hypothetical protein
MLAITRKRRHPLKISTKSWKFEGDLKNNRNSRDYFSKAVHFALFFVLPSWNNTEDCTFPAAWRWNLSLEINLHTRCVSPECACVDLFMYFSLNLNAYIRRDAANERDNEARSYYCRHKSTPALCCCRGPDSLSPAHRLLKQQPI